MTNLERKEKGMVYCYDAPALLGISMCIRIK